MTTPTILGRLAFKGVRISANPSGRLVIDAPRGIVTSADLAELRSRKQDIVESLLCPHREYRRGEPFAPGLVIDEPDPIRRRIALESLGTGPGDAFEDSLEDRP